MEVTKNCIKEVEWISYTKDNKKASGFWQTSHNITHNVELTGHFQGCIVTDGLAQIVPRNTHIATIIWLASSSVDDPQEEKWSAG